MQKKLVAAVLGSILSHGHAGKEPDIDEMERGDFLNLMQKSTGLRGLIRERTDAHWSAPFREALVVSIQPDSYKVSEAQLQENGVPAEMVRGYDGKSPQEVDEALRLLTEFRASESHMF
ncbi:unnamed protein product [Effrenium voratum]|nr:unnamed protein product [Effrenium voratum]